MRPIQSSLVLGSNSLVPGCAPVRSKRCAGLAFFLGLCTLAATWSHSASGWARETPLIRHTSRPVAPARPSSDSTIQDSGTEPEARDDQKSSGIGGYLAGGPGGIGAGDVVVPGGSLTLALFYQTRVGIGVGVGGVCAGGSAQAEHASENRAALLCAGQASLEWVMPTAKFAPLLGLNAGYAHVGFVNPDETSRAFSGNGPMVSARAGVLVNRQWLSAIRVDVPLFPLTLEQDESRSHRAVGIVAELGFRFPAR